MNKKVLKYIVFIVIFLLIFLILFLAIGETNNYSNESKNNDFNSTRIVIEDSDIDKEDNYDYYVENNKEYVFIEKSEEHDKSEIIDYKEDIVKEEVIEVEEEIETNAEDIIEEEIKIENEDVITSEDEEDEYVKEDDENAESKDEKNINDVEKENIIEELDEKEIIEEKKELKNGFIEENGNKYYYENDVMVNRVKEIDGTKHYFKANGVYLGTNNIKVIDVSYYQGIIDWDRFLNESDCYGVILRLGYYNTLDTTFERNINELKRLNIPYGIYLFSYAKNYNDAVIESNFVNEMISRYDIKPELGIYYDIEDWTTKKSSSNNITKSMYDTIIKTFVNSVSNYTNNSYKVKLYSGRWYAMNRLNNESKSFVDWVAEYNSTCKYDSFYSMWQFTSKGSVAGIEGDVDISYIVN